MSKNAANKENEMKSTFDREEVVKELDRIPNNQTGKISDGKGTTREVWRGSSGLFVYANRPDMAPRSVGEMADLICLASQTA